MMKTSNDRKHIPGVSAYVDGKITWRFWLYLAIGLLFMALLTSPTWAQNDSVNMVDQGHEIALVPQPGDPVVELNYNGIQMLDSAYINTNENFTYEGSFSWFVWVNTTSTYPYGYILSDYSNDNYPNCRLQMRSTGQVRLMFKMGSSTITMNSPEGVAINDGVDHLIGFAIDRENWVAKMYVDAEMVTSVLIDGQTDVLSNSAPFWVGTKNSSQIYSFRGILDNVAIYKRALLNTEIEYMYGGGDMVSSGDPMQLQTDDLVLLYDFEYWFDGQAQNAISGTLGDFVHPGMSYVDHRDR